MSEFNSIESTNKCNSCKAQFTSIDVLKEHYRSNWHIFNSKRRANNLAPLSLSDFKKISPGLKLNAPNLSKLPDKKTAQDIEYKSKSTGVKITETDVNILGFNSNKSSLTDIKDLAIKYGVKPERIDSIVELALQDGKDDLFLSNDDNENPGYDDDDILSKQVYDQMLDIKATVSIFDDKSFESVEECLHYMELNFGFFIPDREYLTDLDGMLCYLSEKVKIGGICLYCQKQLTPGKSCQNHMINKSHCKIAYEEDIDLDEFEDFYDFSSLYEDISDEDDEDSNGDNLQISSIGELILPDGRTVGNREFNLYYKQRFRPQDNRPSILAQKREELLRLETLFGAIKMDPTSIERLSDAQVVAMIKKERKEERKSLIIAQRVEQRQRFKAQRREYKSNVDALRSSQNTTAKIRDYHSMIM